ncbi:MAG: baeS 1 [Microbacterium sp.]|nr:baeS 1 [Microbacterium sp.]
MFSARVKTLGAILVVACAGLLVAGGVTFSIQYARTMDDVDDRLHERVASLRSVETFDTAEAYLDSAVSGYLSAQSEGVVGVIDGQPEVRPDGGNQFAAVETPEVLAAARAAFGARPSPRTSSPPPSSWPRSASPAGS